ncbi:MAG: hypothetical protein BroJett003_19190 [Planctomycetota bacterium]|nr:MAG: hypothetical protein BroJett003_19190 [Planctomycetota bacterium]
MRRSETLNCAAAKTRHSLGSDAARGRRLQSPPVQPEAGEVFAETVRVVRRAATGPRGAEEATAGGGKRGGFAADLSDVGKLNAIELVDRLGPLPEKLLKRGRASPR